MGIKTVSFEVVSVLALVTEQSVGRPCSAALLGVLRRRLLMRQQDAVIESDGGVLLVRRGHPVAALDTRGTRLPAWTHFEALSGKETLRVFHLSAVQAAALFAALDGQLRSQSQTAQGTVAGRLAQVQAERFSGLLIMTLPGGCGVWVLEQGVIEAEERWAAQFHLPTLQVAWTARESGEFGAAEAHAAGVPIPPAAPDTRQIWEHFYRLSQLHLGEAADRVTRQMWHRHGAHHGQNLLGPLARQVERFAGPAAAQRFLDPFAGPADSSSADHARSWETP